MGLRDQLREVIPGDVLVAVPDRFDVVGDIAILQLPPGLDEYWNAIADTILSRRRNIQTVLNKKTKLCGGERIAQYVVLSGSKTITTHHEYGCTYKLDVSTVFFNPRLASERYRITSQIHPGERMLVPFCGVGPFVIPAARAGARVTGIEKNKEAVQWFESNCRENKVQDRVTFIEGDAFDLSILHEQVFDRAIIPTPYGMDRIFDVIAPVVRPDGMIHFYTFRKSHEIRSLEEGFVDRGFQVLVRRRCGNVAPGVSRWVFDLRKKS